MGGTLRHEALSYAGLDGFTEACCDVVRTGLDAGDKLIVLAGSAKLATVEAGLGAAAGEVTFVPLDDHGRNPSRIMTMLHTFQAGADGRHCVGVNESVLADRTPAALAEAQLSEFLYNDAALAGWPMTLVCLYDDSLSGTALDSMRQSHSVVRGLAENPWFRPDGASALRAVPLEPPPAAAAHLLAGPHQLAEMRAFVRQHAGASRLGADRVDDLVLAANEIVTNSVRYGGGRADIAVWAADGGVVCDVRDIGRLTDALLGRFAPAPSSASGRGMYLANQLCDLVQVRSSTAGTTVRMYLLP